MSTPTFTLTPKMQAQIDSCPIIGQSNRGCFSAQAQAQVSAVLPMSHRLYSINGAHYMVPAVYVRVSVPDPRIWGEYTIVDEVVVPAEELRDGAVVVLSQAEFDRRVEAATAKAAAIAQSYR